ncbi:MAG: c-type cytochrome [Chthoniobacter sp.]|nr:c-type cytochrome [Chthoniobacter sp.]
MKISVLAALACLALLTAPLHAQDRAARIVAPQSKPAPTPGVALTFSASGSTDTRTARLVALEVPAGQPAATFLPTGPFAARWEADILSDLRAEFSFAAEVQGAVKVTLNSAVILEGSARVESLPVKLQKGANRLVVDFTSPAKGDALLRLLWSSKEFPWEPVPPTVFQHDANLPALRAGTALRDARLLFAQLRCTACHDAAGLLPAKGEGMPELAQDAPQFGELGAKFNEPWLAAWINDPHAIRPHALMPKVFPGKPGEIDQRAADLAAYFVSLGGQAEEKPQDSALIAPGGALFANLGCIACHSRPDADADAKDEFDRIPLTHVRAKWAANKLTAYLKDPAQSFAWNRMPHFRLSDDEAAKLTAYLFLSAKREFPAGPKGDATRGSQLLVSSGCLNCHAGLLPTTAPTFAVMAKTGWTKGCLGPDAAARGKAPDFALTPAQREALVAFAATGLGSLKQDVPAEFAERQIANLRCTACHARDGQASVWSQLESEMEPLKAAAPLEEGEGKPVATTVLPALTWLGEKLHPAWMAQFIAGHGKDKPRPWLIARMPGFPAGVADGLAAGLSHSHGFPLTDPAPAAPDAAKLKAGATLLTENGGFNCVQCHGLGDRAATAVFEAPGPNFALTRERIRPHYFHRWLLFPTRIDAETKMPRFADDSGKTPITEFFDGKASEHYDAIWQYLQSFKK